MAKSVKAIISVIVAFAVLLPCILFSSSGVAKNETQSFENYLNDLNAIYSKYNDFSSVDEKNEYALSRILVNGWNGKKYGAVMTAYDSKNDFAVLQYNSPSAAENAESKMLSDGLSAEADSIARLDSAEKCTMSPENSSALGINSYLDNFAMSKDDVTVAVVDTGVMYDHEAIAQRFCSEGVDFSGDNCEDAYYDTTETGDYYGHGTFICGVIADNTPDTVSILPVKVVQFETEATSASAIISGINYAVSYGAKVISVSVASFGAENSFKKAVNNALSNGVCICASAGNDGTEITDRYPGCIEGVITVSALNGDFSAPASYTNYGDVIDFCAPGNRIYSTYPENGQSSYRNWSGTSFSTPYIAAMCADLKTIDSEMSKTDVYETLCDFAHDKGEAGFDVYCGNGMPDIGSMVYSQENLFELSVPQGVLSVYGSADYTEDTQPWRIFASKIRRVSINSAVTSVGSYMFYNLSSAVFTYSQRFINVGDYAFYNCSQLKSAAFGVNVESIGYKAFGGIENFTIKGYLNTPAEIYSLNENIRFVKLGCNHNYFYEVFEPDGDESGYTLYTCSVCGDSYRGAYIQPNIISSGSCGENLTYYLDDTGRLTIDGSGDMYDYFSSAAPWYDYRADIKILNIKSNVGSVSPFAFYGCNNVVKLYVSENNSAYSTDGISLFNKAETEIVLTFARGSYSLPEGVEAISAPALIPANNISLKSNEKLTVENSLVCDENGNILAALPNYRERTLIINEPLSISRYAFILSEYPQRLETGVVSVFPGEYSLGYTYNGTMIKHDLTVKACAESGVSAYAVQNGFTLEDGVYKCGDELTYTYDSELTTLVISGTGAMTEYSSASQIPWYSVMSSITTVEISDTVTALSRYAFYGASTLYYLTMPLSMAAPEDDTVWSGCTAVKTINLTYGSGIMDDYLGDNGEKYYNYMPWYISRGSITDMTLDSEVKYVGNSAFRGCSVLTTLTLNSVEEIAPDAFLACPKLRDLTILSKNAIINDYSILSYYTGTHKIYQGFTVKGYKDSTVRDYCERLGAGFESLGCGHSRSVNLLSEETEGTNLISTYYCNDCLEEFTGITDMSLTLCGTVVTTRGDLLSGAAVSAGGNTALCDNDGRFTLSGLTEGTAAVSVAVNGTTLINADVTVSGNNTEVIITVRYADYVSDGVINAKDYAYAFNNGFNDRELFDFGRIENGDNKVETVNNEN